MDFEARANEAEKLIELIQKKIEALEKVKKSKTTFKSNIDETKKHTLNQPSAAATHHQVAQKHGKASSAHGPVPNKFSVLKFASAKDAAEYLRRNDKFWLFRYTSIIDYLKIYFFKLKKKKKKSNVGC